MNYNNTNHPLINNSHEYLFTKKFLSIHSEDRDLAKFPLAAQFDIELPQEYANVVKVQLVEWSFPSNYYTFSAVAKNLLLSFKINDPYDAELFLSSTDPVNNPTDDDIEIGISAGLIAFKNSLFVLQIDEGFYNPIQMATELTNRLNKTVTDYLNSYFTSNGYSQPFIDKFNNTTNGVPNQSDGNMEDIGGYKEFVVFYNIISQKLYFGNRSSRFTIPNIITPPTKELVEKYFYLGCTLKRLPQYTDKLLLFNLGFDITPTPTVTLTNQQYARIYYGDALTLSNGADNGIWLFPSIVKHPGCNVSYMIPRQQINFMGPSHFYLEINELNNMDELNPYPSIPSFTEISTDPPPNRVNSAFCKISVNSTPISQWYDRDNTAFKLFNPPLEKLRKLRIKVRYHDGTTVLFGSFAYSITLEISMFNPQQLTTLKTIYPYGI